MKRRSTWRKAEESSLFGLAILVSGPRFRLNQILSLLSRIDWWALRCWLNPMEAANPGNTAKSFGSLN